MPFASSFVALGVDDAINTCDHCGKKNLKCTVALEVVETGDVVHYGRDCAGAALYGRKSRSNTELAEVTARRRAILETVAAKVRDAIAAGATPAEATAIGNKVGRTVRVAGGGVSAEDCSKFVASAPRIQLYANGIGKPYEILLRAA